MPSRQKLWADNLLKSPSTGVAVADNRSYEADGSSLPRRENEDGHFNCVFNSTSLLMVLDGHDGSRALEYVKEQMPEKILRMVEETISHDEIKTNFVSVFKEVEKGFFDSMDDLLTDRAVLKIDLNECPNSSVAWERYPEHVTKVDELDEQIRGGTTVAVAVIKHNDLFVANVGDTRVLLCMVNPANHFLLVDQLTVDHTTSSELELQRLAKLGLDPAKLKESGRLGMHQNTRCIGDFSIKNGYMDIDLLKNSKLPPGIAEPHVAGPVSISQSRGFVIVMSDGLYDAWSSCMGQDTHKANTELARMVAEQIRGSQQSMDVVAKTVVDLVVSSVQSTYIRTKKKECQRLDDITLMVHNLGFDISQFPLAGVAPFPLTTSPINPPQLQSFYSQPTDPHVHHQPQPLGYQQPSNVQYIRPQYAYQFGPGGQQQIVSMPYGYPMPANIPSGYQYPPPQSVGYQPSSNVGYQQPSLNTGYQSSPNTGYQPPPPSQMNVRAESPFVFPPYGQQQQQQPVLPQNASFGDQVNMSAISGHNVSGNFSGNVSSNAANQSSNYGSQHPSFSIGSSNLSGNAGNNTSYSTSNASGGNTSNLMPQVNQVSGRHSPQTQFTVSPQPQVSPKLLSNFVSAQVAQAQPIPSQQQQLPPVAGDDVGGNNQPIQSSGDSDAATPISEPSSKEVFSPSQPVEQKPVPLRRKKTISSGTDDNKTPVNVLPEQPTYPPNDNIPPPQQTSTPKKEGNEFQKPSNRDSLDIPYKDDDLYGSDKEGEGDGTLEAPSAGEGESMVIGDKLMNSQPDTEPPKSTEGNQLDQYIFDSDAEPEPELADDHVSSEEDDDDKMGTVDTSKLSHFTSEEPASEDDNTVHSYIKFDASFPDIDYDTL